MSEKKKTKSTKKEKKPEEKPKTEKQVEKKEEVKSLEKIEEPKKEEKVEEKKPEVKEEVIEEDIIEKEVLEVKPTEEIEEVKIKEELESWVPKTSLGKSVMKGQTTDINKILDEGIKIREPEIVDMLIPNLQSELAFIGGRPGKGGGIERTPLRISAKMHRSGRRYTSTAFAIVGNQDGIIGIGKGRGKESREAINKAIRNAKLNIIKIPRGCGSWECECGQPHSIPFKTEGKSGSVRITLLPAPKGIGLAVDDETKKILKLAGIKDIWGNTLGDTGTRMNLIQAVNQALMNLHHYRIK
jgi:small subunit ribosomal protein S5